MMIKCFIQSQNSNNIKLKKKARSISPISKTIHYNVREIEHRQMRILFNLLQVSLGD